MRPRAVEAVVVATAGMSVPSWLKRMPHLVADCVDLPPTVAVVSSSVDTEGKVSSAAEDIVLCNNTQTIR
jgi:hypothetical protein